MRYLIIILILLASCSPRKIQRIEKIKTRTIDTTITVPRDIIRAVRPLRFMETIVVENERVRTEVRIDTVLMTVEVESEVKETTHKVKATEVTETKTKDVKRSGHKWWHWYIAGAISVILLYVVIRMK